MGLFDGTSLERPVTCEACGEPTAECHCPRSGDGSVCLPGDQAVRVRREKRRGKWVTVAAGFDPVASDTTRLLKQAKARYAAGGGTSDDGFELQGDRRDALVEWLRELGYDAKPAGG